VSPQAPASAVMAHSRVPQAIRRNISSPNPSDKLSEMPNGECQIPEFGLLWHFAFVIRH
jgi:hypothetical protein